ncbi:MAG: Bacterial transferase hexapeptide (Six repeats) [Promethearchaeota archaeon]|nr:MAG: Bacterial transferase hexapeptide (Six repeats) [Candidatus Lokiarchaeota archaeon]
MSSKDKKDKRELLLDVEEEGIPKEEVSLNLFWYLFAFLSVYLGSYIVPAIVFMTYVMLFLVPNFLDNPNFISIFTELEPLLTFLFWPFIIIVCYLLRLFFMALITRIIWRYTERKSPSKDGIIPRNIQSKTLEYYHKRSFIIKYPKNTFVKGIFPWLYNWLINFVGSGKIGKGTTIEESVVSDRFIDVGENCYIGPNVSLASHLVEGIFGNISYFEIKIGDNVTAPGENAIGPGVEIRDNSYLFPLASITKYSILKGDNYYFGMPPSRAFSRKTKKFLKVSDEDLERAERLKEKQMQEQGKRHKNGNEETKKDTETKKNEQKEDNTKGD